LQENNLRFVLYPIVGALNTVTANARKAFLQSSKGKIIITPEALASNSGVSVIDVLEKTPGVIVDRNGGLALQGKMEF